MNLFDFFALCGFILSTMNLLVILDLCRELDERNDDYES